MCDSEYVFKIFIPRGRVRATAMAGSRRAASARCGDELFISWPVLALSDRGTARNRDRDEIGFESAAFEPVRPSSAIQGLVGSASADCDHPRPAEPSREK